MSKDKFKNQRKPTQKEIDAMDNYDKPLKPLPELPSGGMGGKKGGVVKKKIIKAQLGKIIKNNLSPQQKMQLDTYKKTVVDERSNKESERMDQEQKDSYMKRISEYQAQPKYKSKRGPYAEDAMEEPRRERMPSPEMEEMEELKELYRRPMQGAEVSEGAQGAVGEAIGRKKGGMVRGQGIAIRGTKFKGIF